ncbi:uncharacterized protein B0T15DRAFT_493479 [Chaetomium strumarium]|uniref:Heterokaryon incompatibility domain-containing protein n=1 Tax=Chaetomium strumarium TaxID=1170767 RepID=A0AAJ0GSF3_9PEZI|nr:hypothetical protein B0T15DRAFT_493479 [Chaetomium strumarium]
MRLLNTETLQLETFVSHETSRYAILSHTWDEDETLFEDLRGKPPGPLNTGKAGDAKIDTCCINKSSSAELSEAINSMFEWYRACQICYAYLSDVTDGDEAAPQSSRWLTRGWTLQELIAPDEVVFCNKYWEIIGNRRDLAAHLSNLTRIDEAILHRDPGVDVNRLLAEIGVAARMSWIRHRQTTRKEDMAYCLMRLFDVNMPLLYGEGTKAYTRLQQEIIKNIDDQSILAHWTLGTRDGWEGLLARVPPRSQFLRVPLLAKVLKVSSLRPPDNSTELNRTWLAVLDCHHASDFLIRPAILLEPLNGSMESGYRSFRKIGPVAWLIPPAHAAGNDLQVGAVYCNRAETLKDIETEQHPFKARWQLQAGTSAIHNLPPGLD